MLTNEQAAEFLDKFYWASRKVIRFEGVDRRKFATALGELSDLISDFEFVKDQEDATPNT